MKISKLFHWLYALLMFLPIVNVFAYTLRYGFNYGNSIPTVTENVQKTVDFNQLISSTNNNLPYEVDGITFTSTNDGAYILNGTATADTFIVIYRDSDTNSNHQYLNYDFNNSQDVTICYNNTFSTANTIQYGNTFNCTISVKNGASFSDYIYKCNLYDLTQMFGVGNEPTLQEFRTWFPDSYYPYTLSEYVVIPDYSSVSVSDDVTNHFWLPQFGQVGHSINNVIGFLLSNVFGLVVSEGIGYIVCGLFTYWLIISLSWLIFDVLMYVPLLVHRWLDKASIS